MDNNGCLLEDEVSVFVKKELLVYRPTAFSPNGDGENDYFVLFAKDSNIDRIEYFQVLFALHVW